MLSRSRCLFPDGVRREFIRLGAGVAVAGNEGARRLEGIAGVHKIQRPGGERQVLARVLRDHARRELQQVERQLRTITEDQDRLRKNLHEMPKEAVAYKRYLKKFDDQETQIEQLQKQQKELQDTEHVRRQDYETFLANLSVE